MKFTQTRFLCIPLAVLSAISLSCAPTPSANTDATTDDETVPAPAVEDSNIPVGRPDPNGRKNMVISPYRPYNLIDVKGYRSGEVVGDPSTAKVDPTTGKLDARTAKFFRVP